MAKELYLLSSGHFCENHDEQVLRDFRVRLKLFHYIYLRHPFFVILQGIQYYIFIGWGKIRVVRSDNQNIACPV